MSELAIRDRLMDIYSQQAAMGMGCMNEYLSPMSDPYGNGLMIGGAGKRKRKLSSYNIFVKKFMAANRDKYDSVTDAMSAAARSWRKCRKTKGKKTKIGKKKVSCSRRRKTYRRKGGYLDDEESDDDDYFGDGLIVGGAEKKKKVKRSDLPSAAQLKALGMTAADFNLLKEQTRTTSRGFTVPKYATPQLARLGRRFGSRYVGADGKKRCRGPNSSGSFFLDGNYDCVDYVAPITSPVAVTQYPEIAAMDRAYQKSRQSMINKMASQAKETMTAEEQLYVDRFNDLLSDVIVQSSEKKRI
jgi:hypothetical protein